MFNTVILLVLVSLVPIEQPYSPLLTLSGTQQKNDGAKVAY